MSGSELTPEHLLHDVLSKILAGPLLEVSEIISPIGTAIKAYPINIRTEAKNCPKGVAGAISP